MGRVNWRPVLEETRLETWFERDRANVRLMDTTTTPETELLDVWDDAVFEALEDGFLDRRELHRSAYSWWLSMQSPEGER